MAVTQRAEIQTVAKKGFYWPWLWTSWLFWVNFLFFQWFFVRLCEVIDRDTQKHMRWEFLQWLVPLTGWWSEYRYWPYNKSSHIWFPPKEDK